MTPVAKQLDTEILSEYINTFYGYGQWQAKYWFVGIEEGGGNEIENVERRLNSWIKLRKAELLDCQLHHRNMGTFNDGNKNKLHTQTWTKLIITKLSFDDADFSKESIIKIQYNDWGGINCDHLLIELLPLPSPGLNKWCYEECGWVNLNSKLNFLENRDTYKARVIPQRVHYIKDKLNLYQPEFVIFYGSTMKNHWEDIIGVYNTQYFKIGRYSVGYTWHGTTLCILCPQPNYIRPYMFWIELGRAIKELKQPSVVSSL